MRRRVAAYRELLQRRGFLAHGRLRRTDFLHEFERAHDRRQMRRIGLWFDVASPYSWPAKLVVGAGECHPPLRHIVLMRFLGCDANGFIELARSLVPRSRGRRGPTSAELTSLRRAWADRTCSLNEIGRRLGVHWHTVRGWATAAGLELPRFAAPAQRKEFRQLRTRMRQAFRRGRSAMALRTCVKWLGRNDGKWLQAHRARPRSAPPRIDWKRRDMVLAASAPRAARRLKSMRPFRRVTLLGIAGELRCLSTVERHRKRLPRFARRVSGLVEDSRTFALRRIAGFQRERPNLPPWRLREVAGISGPLMEDRAILRAMRYRPRFNHGNKPSAS